MKFLSVNQAATQLGTSRDNIKKWMRRGELKYKEVGSRLVTTDLWLNELKPDCSQKYGISELNHEYFYKKKA